MSLDKLGIPPLQYDTSSHIDLAPSAKLYTLESSSVGEEHRPDLHAIGLDFLDELSDRSFRMRFGTTKPNEKKLSRLVDHFLDGRRHPHAMLLLMHEQQLLGAASIFGHTLRALAYGEVTDTSHVAELSVTVTDELQGQGLGKLLLTQARQYAISAGYTHVYFGFESANEASRRMVERVCGAEQLVAGATNPRDKYYRLTMPSLDFSDIEQTMRAYCDGETPLLEDLEDHSYRYPRLAHTKLGRKVLDTLESIDIVLPSGFRFR